MKQWMKIGMIGTALFIGGFGGTVMAGGVMPSEAITIEGKKPARFEHAVHQNLGLDCGQCHHDAQHQPLTAEAIGALGSTDQLRCASCHNESFANAKLQRRMDVFHSRCKECHKAGIDGKTGPTNCTACHVKKKSRPAIEGC